MIVSPLPESVNAPSNEFDGQPETERVSDSDDESRQKSKSETQAMIANLPMQNPTVFWL